MFELPKLKYQYEDLEPYFDAATMRIHHTKHHQGYVNNLNNAISKFPEFEEYSLVKLLTSLEEIPTEIRTTVRNNGGGHYNHSFFFNLLRPTNQTKTSPSESLLKKIESTFGSLDNLKATFYSGALNNFGSGWTWLCLNHQNELVVLNTSGHDCPITNGFRPLLCIDIWEHAYYLKFQNRRSDFIETFWEVIDWDVVNQLYSKY